MTHKPRPQSKKLSFRRETIRQLSDLELARAHGGQAGAIALDTAATCVTTDAQQPTVLTCLGC